MARVKTGYTGRQRRKKILKAAKGYRGARSRCYRIARQTVERAWVYAYRDRRTKKREFRRLWIARINAFTREHGLKYSEFIHLLKVNGIDLDRKVLADMAVSEPEALKAILDQVKASNASAA